MTGTGAEDPLPFILPQIYPGRCAVSRSFCALRRKSANHLVVLFRSVHN